MNYEDSIKLITSKGMFYVDLGLDRISAALEKLGNPQDDLKYIHVAGTNGKGSVCTILESILREAGYKTGLYTSPHIWEYTERIKVCGEEIPKDKFANYIEKITNLGIHLTEFEILTIMMFLYFKEQNVDIVILETGLGGRFDATNVIKNNLCSIITHIDLDHTDRLGNTKSKIAFEKAGIIKPNCPVFTSEGYEEIKDKADAENSLFVMVAPFEDTTNLALKGTCQQENLSLALASVRYLFPQISEATIQEALTEVKHPCRFELCRDDLIIDASHNPNGVMALRESLDFYYPYKKRCFVFGCLKNKDYEKMIQILFSRGDEIYFYHFNNPNSCSIEELQAVCEYPSHKFKSLDELPKDYMKIICGSFYMLNEIVPESLVLQPFLQEGL